MCQRAWLTCLGVAVVQPVFFAGGFTGVGGLKGQSEHPAPQQPRLLAFIQQP